MKQYAIYTRLVSLLTVVFLYSCNAPLDHHNMTEEAHSNSHPLSRFDHTILTREEAIKNFSNLKAIGAGGQAVVYDSDNGSVLRIKASSRPSYSNYDHKIFSALRAIKESNKELPMADIYAIFKIDTHRSHFQPEKIFHSLLEKPHAIAKQDTFATVVVMQKVKLYPVKTDFSADILDFALAVLFLQSHGIEYTDQPNITNLGYLLQDKPVQYTFKINGTLKTYQVIGQRAQEGTKKLYKKTILIDYDEWKTNCPVNHSDIQRQLDNLVRAGKIEKLCEYAL